MDSCKINGLRLRECSTPVPVPPPTLPHNPFSARSRRPKFLVVFEGCSGEAPHCAHADTAEIRSLPASIGEVLKLLEIRLGCRPAGRAIDHHAGCRRRQQGAPHGEENTCIDAHPPIAVRADRGTPGLAGRPGGTGQAGDAADRRGGAGGGVPGCARPRLLRARRRGRPGLSQRRADGPAEDGGGADRLRRAAGRRPRGAVPLGDPQPSEGPDRGAGGAGGRAAGPRPLGARHRGRLPRRERPAALVAHRGLRARRAALGRLPGLRQPRPRASTRSSTSSSTASPSASVPASGASR